MRNRPPPSYPGPSAFTAGAGVEDRTLPREDTYPSFGPIYSTTDIGPTAALRIADVFACVRALADSAACLPLIAYRRLEDETRERSHGHLADLLDDPAPATTQANLVGQLVAHLNLHGNAYLGKYRDADGQVAQIAALDPTGIEVELRAGQPVYTRRSQSGTREHGPADICAMRAMSLDGLKGLSPIGQARKAVALGDSLATHADSFARNSGRPGGVLRIGSIASADLTRADLDAEIGKPEQSGRILLLTGGTAGDVDFSQLTMSMVDAEFVAQRGLSTAEIARVFRVPPWIIGAPSGDSMTYSNTEQQSLAFVQFSLLPWLRVIEQAISNDADLSPTTVFVEFLLDGLLRADSQTRANFYTAALSSSTGWMRREEVRRLENLPAEDESQVPKPPPILQPFGAPPVAPAGGAPESNGKTTTANGGQNAKP